MVQIDKMALKGEFEMKLFGPDGLLKQYRKVSNLTVNTGFSTVCKMMGQGGHAAFGYCGIGNGAAAPSTLNVTLANELARQQGAFTQLNNLQWKNESTFSPGVGSGTIVESAMFNSASSGTMLCRQTFGAIAKESADTLVVTWQYTLSAA